jgi:ornithine cyclodeaminase/alanine dehydrogenase-like protein (mu-crystallin family)
MDDVVTAAYVLRNAREHGLGTSLRLRNEPLWM